MDQKPKCFGMLPKNWNSPGYACGKCYVREECSPGTAVNRNLLDVNREELRQSFSDTAPKKPPADVAALKEAVRLINWQITQLESPGRNA